MRNLRNVIAIVGFLLVGVTACEKPNDDHIEIPEDQVMEFNIKHIDTETAKSSEVVTLSDATFTLEVDNQFRWSYLENQVYKKYYNNKFEVWFDAGKDVLMVTITNGGQLESVRVYGWSGDFNTNGQPVITSVKDGYVFLNDQHTGNFVPHPTIPNAYTEVAIGYVGDAWVPGGNNVSVKALLLAQAGN